MITVIEEYLPSIFKILDDKENYFKEKTTLLFLSRDLYKVKI